jgi:phage gp16-like protein
VHVGVRGLTVYPNLLQATPSYSKPHYLSKDHTMPTVITDRRKTDLGIIHMAKAHFGWSDDEYRDILFAVTGCRSAKDLDFSKRNVFVAHCKKLGFVVKAKSSKTRPTAGAGKAGLIARIRAQLISLGNKPDAYADGLAVKMFGTDASTRFEWSTVEQLRKITAALGYQQQRQGANTNANIGQ